MRDYEFYDVDMTPGTAGRWVARVTNLPGCLTQGRSEKEALRKINDALKRCFKAYDVHGLSIDRVRRPSIIVNDHPFPEVSGSDACLALFYLGWRLVATSHEHMLLVRFDEDPVVSVPFDVALDRQLIRRLAEDGHLDLDRFAAALNDRNLGMVALAESEYADFVDHPRFGGGPRITGLNPGNKSGMYYEDRIPNTGIHADPSKHNSTWPITVEWYFDLKRVCRGCSRKFIFFAEEQKHWYEELQLPLDADAVRCVACRKSEQRIARLRARYEALLKAEPRSDEQSFEFVEAGLTLVDEGVFVQKALEHLRAVLKKLPDTSERKAGLKELADELLERLRS